MLAIWGPCLVDASIISNPLGGKTNPSALVITEKYKRCFQLVEVMDACAGFSCRHVKTFQSSKQLKSTSVNVR